MSARVRAVLGIAISVVLLGLLLQFVSVADVIAAVRSCDPVLLFAAVLVHGLMLLARLQRFSTLAGEPRISRAACEAVFVGWLANLTLPAKAGELARPAVYARRSEMSFVGAAAAVIVERLLDLVSLAALFATAVLAGLPPDTPAWIEIAAKISGGLALAGLVGLGVLARLGAFPMFREGLSALEGTRLPVVLLLSVLVWALEVLAAWLCIDAVGALPEGAWAASAVLVVATTLAVAAPAGPAGLGVEQWVALGVLAVWGIEGSAAVAISFVMLFAAAAFIVPIGLAMVPSAMKGADDSSVSPGTLAE